MSLSLENHRPNRLIIILHYSQLISTAIYSLFHSHYHFLKSQFTLNSIHPALSQSIEKQSIENQSDPIPQVSDPIRPLCTVKTKNMLNHCAFVHNKFIETKVSI